MYVCIYEQPLDVILLILWCAFNELQQEDEVADSDYTNFPVHVLTKNQLTKASTKEFIFPNTTQ